MSHSTTYDIFELAKELKEAVINEKATNAIVKFEKAKDDAINNDIVAKIEASRIDIKKDIKLSRYKTLIWLGGAIISGFVSTIGILGYLITLHH